MKNTSRSRLLLSGAIALTLVLSACSKGSDSPVATGSVEDGVREPSPETTLAPAVQDTALSSTPETTLDQNAQDNKQIVLDMANSFDRQLRSQAAFGTAANPNDTDPRRMGIFLDMAGFGDLPDASTTGTALANDQLRVLMWQGAGKASVKWTRISCPAGVCANVDSAGGTMVSAVGENSKLYNPEARASICLQFHRAGQSAWMNVSTSANTQGVISDVLETACPASVFPGITAATGTTYADLSATPGEALVDPTW